MNWPRRLLALALGLGTVFFGLGQMGGAILSVGLLAPASAVQMGQSLAGRDPHLGLFWT
ncbi:hypothetical protein ACVWXE_000481 [Thermostichus sp. MS-CIW-41]|jgi:hypothetical protein